jgi:hypothetical protein
MSKAELDALVEEATLDCYDEPRHRHHLSHAHVQMARELGLNPKKLGKIDNHRHEPWKQPLPRFIEDLYLKRFRRERPETTMSIEERAQQIEQSKLARREPRAAAHVETENPRT